MGSFGFGGGDLGGLDGTSKGISSCLKLFLNVSGLAFGVISFGPLSRFEHGLLSLQEREKEEGRL